MHITIQHYSTIEHPEKYYFECEGPQESKEEWS